MRNKDNVILESLYQSIYIKEAVFQLTQSKMLEDVLKKVSSANAAKTKYELTDDDGSRLLNKWLQSCTDEVSQVAQQSAGAIILVKDLTGNGEQVNITQKVKAVASTPVDIHSADTHGQDQNIKYKAAWVEKYKDLINKKTPYMLIFSAYQTKRNAASQEMQRLEQMFGPFIELLKTEGYDARIESDGSTTYMGVVDEHYLTDFYTALRFVDYVAQQVNSTSKKAAKTYETAQPSGGIRYTVEYKIKGGDMMVTTRPDEELVSQDKEDTEEDTEDYLTTISPDYTGEEDKAVFDEEYYHHIYVAALEALVDQGIDFSSLDRDKAKEIIRDYLMDPRRDSPLSENEIDEKMLERAVNDSRMMGEDDGEFGDGEDEDEEEDY